MATINRREFTKRLASGVLGSSLLTSGALSLEMLSRRRSKDRRPNFIFLCSDQHSAKYAGFAGHPFIKTPNLDRLAHEGVVFSSAYCGSPLCVPGRSSMMTGMYPSDVNSFCNSTVYDGSYPTWGKRLQHAGYYCWAVGKQDLNPECDLGFAGSDVDNGHAKKPDITSLFRRPVGYRVGEREIIDGGLRGRELDDAVAPKESAHYKRDEMDAAKAVRFIRGEAPGLTRPWALFIGLREPHPPWAGTKEYYEYYLPLVSSPQVSIDELECLPLPYQAMRNFKRISTPIPEERTRRAAAAYLSMVSELDDRIGAIYRSLEEAGQIENTYFIYTSDHGESLGEHGMWLKNNLYEGAVRVPLLISGPGLPKGKVIDRPVAHVDLVATMIQWAGVKIPPELRGSSLVSLLEGRPEGGPQFVYSESHSEGNPTGSCMIRQGDWKLMHFSYYQDYLFNLRDDPDEKRNRADDPSAQGVLRDLTATLRGQVDPEEITEKAFAAQRKVLDGLVRRMNEEELFAAFRSRLGDGQARIMARMLKNENG